MMKLKISLLVLGFAFYTCIKLEEVDKSRESLYNLLLPSASRASTPIASLPGSDKVNISGKVTGLGSGKWVKIKVNDTETTLTEDQKIYYFLLGHPKGSEYKLEAVETSQYLSCTITNSTGTPIEDVNNADVNCAFNPPPNTLTYTVGGTVIGLTGTITLSMTGSISQTKTISVNGSYVFDTSLLETQTYNVTISTHSTTSFCFLVNANSNQNMNQTGTMGTSNVTNVNIQCVGRITLNEAISNQNASCASNSPDYIEIKNISGSSVSDSGWYHCDQGICGTTFNASSMGLVAFAFSSLASGAYHAVNTSYGLGSSDGVYLVYESGGKKYLVEQHSWTSHVIPARKSPDGAYNGSTVVTSSQSSWINENVPANCTKESANP